MNARETQLYARAGLVAEIAMGRERKMRGDVQGEKLAVVDPLAWWCLTEAIVGIAHWYKHPTARLPDPVGKTE